MNILRSTAKTAGLLALSLACLAIPGEAGAKTHAATKAVPLTKRERAEHALDRLTFGPRTGDVERVEKIGVERWIDQQLHPERIDDGGLEAKLNALPAMRLSTGLRAAYSGTSSREGAAICRKLTFERSCGKRVSMRLNASKRLGRPFE